MNLLSKIAAYYRKRVPTKVRGWVNRMARIGIAASFAYIVRNHVPITPAAFVGAFPGIVEAGWRAATHSPEEADLLAWLESQAPQAK